MKSAEPDVDLRLNGKTISRCCFDTALILEVLEKGSRTSIRIGGLMNIHLHGVERNLSGEKPAEVGEAFVLIGKTIKSAVGRGDGSLRISFEDGTELLVPIDPHYEAWEVNSTDGFMVISLPGGKLSTWKPQ